MLSSMVHLYLMHQGKFLIDIPLASCHCTVDMEPDPDIYIKQKKLTSCIDKYSNNNYETETVSPCKITCIR